MKLVPRRRPIAIGRARLGAFFLTAAGGRLLWLLLIREDLMRLGWMVILATVFGIGLTSLAEDPKPAAPAAPAAVPAARFEISRETTFVTGPVRADGTIDYVEAINEHLS